MSQPDLITISFAESASPDMVFTIPNVAQPGDVPAKASWSVGFPAITTLPLIAGGQPPQGQDINGVLRSISRHTRYLCGGGLYLFSDQWVTAVGGYSESSIILSDDGLTLYRSRVDQNTVDPNDGENPAVPEFWDIISSVSAAQSALASIAHGIASNQVRNNAQLDNRYVALSGYNAFNPSGDYADLRARGTTADDIGALTESQSDARYVDFAGSNWSNKPFTGYGYVVSSIQPTNTRVLWINLADANRMMFYDHAEEEWKYVGGLTNPTLTLNASTSTPSCGHQNNTCTASTIITAVADNVAGSVTYSWSATGSVNITGSGSQVTASLSGENETITETITCVAIDSAQNEVQTSINIPFSFEYSFPAMSASINNLSNQTCAFPNNGSGCTNSVNATCSVTGGSGTFSYAWSATQGAAINGSGASVTVSRNATGNATVTVTCVVTDTVTGLTTTTTQNFNSTHNRRAALTATIPSVSNVSCTYPSTGSSCQNNRTMTCTAGGGTGSGYSYAWSANNGATIQSGQGTANVNVRRASGSTATVTVTCVVTNDGQSVTATRQFTSTHTQLAPAWDGSLNNLPGHWVDSGSNPQTAALAEIIFDPNGNIYGRGNFPFRENNLGSWSGSAANSGNTQIRFTVVGGEPLDSNNAPTWVSLSSIRAFSISAGFNAGNRNSSVLVELRESGNSSSTISAACGLSVMNGDF